MNRAWVAAVAVGVGAGMAVALAGCNREPSTAVARTASGAGSAAADAARPASAGASGASGPPVSVSTVRAQQRDVDVTLDVTGTVTALSSVDVRPQVASIISKVHIREGQFVKAGQLLFTLDSRNEEGAVAKARSQLVKDQVALADVQRQLARSRDLLAQNFVSQGALDANQTLVDSQLASISASRAALDAARVALSNARVTAPGAGRAGAINVFAGSSVQANQTPLVSITQLDPIAVAFSLPQRHLADALAALKGGGSEVTAVLPEKAGTLSGRLQFVDSAIDAASGSVKVKAVFANRDGKLWPGAFLDVAMNVRTLKDAVVVPQAAIIQSARGPVIYVNENGKAALRPLQVLYAQGDDAAVSGVKAGEAIVLDGRQNLRPGASLVERTRDAAGRPGAGASAPGAAAASGVGRGTERREEKASP